VPWPCPLSSGPPPIQQQSQRLIFSHVGLEWIGTWKSKLQGAARPSRGPVCHFKSAKYMAARIQWRKLGLRCSRRAPEVCKHRAICSCKESHANLSELQKADGEGSGGQSPAKKLLREGNEEAEAAGEAAVWVRDKDGRHSVGEDQMSSVVEAQGEQRGGTGKREEQRGARVASPASSHFHLFSPLISAVAPWFWKTSGCWQRCVGRSEGAKAWELQGRLVTEEPRFPG